MRQPAGSTCGWKSLELRTIYITTMRSVVAYAAPVWAPWMFNTNLQKLERAQLSVARTITVQVRLTPTDEVLFESYLPPLSSCLQCLAALKADDWALLPVLDDRRELFHKAVRKRLKRHDWRSLMSPLLTHFNFLTNFMESEHILEPPWPLPPLPSICFTSISKSASSTQQFAVAVETIFASGPTDLQFYTDEATVNGIANIRLLRYENWVSASTISDSKLLLQTLDNLNNSDQSISAIQTFLAAFLPRKMVELIWVSSHCDFFRNELADKQEKFWSAKPQASEALEHSLRHAIIR